MLDANAHDEINAGLRQVLAGCMPTSSGGILAVWNEAEQYRVAFMDDLTVTFAEHRMAGLDGPDALAALADEIRADRRTGPESHLIGVGIIGHAAMECGEVGSAFAVVDGWSHQVVWPHRNASPVWEIKPADEVDDETCVAYLDAFADLLDALTGPAEGGTR